MADIAWKDGEINYTDEGKGKLTLMLVHGFCESLRMWDDWKQPFLKGDWRLVCVDLPGFGNSTATGDTIETYAASINALVSSLELEQVIMIGHSMGGYVTLAVAETEPDWLKGIGLFHSHPYADNEDTREKRNRSIAFIEENGHFHYLKQLIPRLFPSSRAGSYTHQQDRMMLLASRASQEGIINGQRAMRDRLDRSAFLKETELPVLFINGALDETVSEAQRRDQLALPCRAQLCFLPKAGHMGFIEDSRATQRAVREFLSFCQEFFD
ncbi:MAG: alpha/beta hydrolase [Bacteroidota bacterium]